MATAQDSIESSLRNREPVRRGPRVDIEEPFAPDLAALAAAEPPAPARTGVVGGILSSLPFLIVGAIVAIIGLVVFQTLEVRQSTGRTQYVGTASRLLMVSQRLAKDAREAALGDAAAFESLRTSLGEFDSAIDTLNNGNPALNVPATPPALQGDLEPVQELWTQTRENVKTITEQEELLLATRGRVQRVNELTPLLLAQSDEVVEAVIRESGNPDMINIAGRQRSLSQRIAKDVTVFAQGGSGAAVAATQFGKDTNLFQTTSEQLRAAGGPVVQAKLDAVDETFGELRGNITSILDGVAEFFLAQRAAQSVIQDSEPLLGALQTLVDGASRLTDTGVLRWLPWIFGALAVVFLFLLGSALVMDARRRAEDSARQNRETQDAILKLLDEMGNLAEGDLTIETEVTDQITGAIADSINFAVREMRDLVYRINGASTQVARASKLTAMSAHELSKASAQQADEITNTAERIQAMAHSMENMSGEALRSAEVARNSVEMAKRGARAVRDTIRGMDEMRDQMQETAKRIKRLGESSQQIGEIVGLIDDIAEQTNILSLNAAIQAAMAGEAGKGFAVVADEVQRLAERSAQATKQISDLVKNIQADTNEAIGSMEKATQGVVEGTRLADAAGQSLGEIERVSEQLSELIGHMADAARRQSEAATDVSGKITLIRDVTQTTSTDARKTAESIGKLSGLARELQESVSGFKLPA